jgi:uncharacterized membrane protein
VNKVDRRLGNGAGHDGCAAPCSMANIERSVDVLVPVRTAYDQWTQFEQFPRFMRHVKSVRQVDDRRLLWRVELGGQVREFEAEIVEQIPDKRIAWRTTAGLVHQGVITFHRLASDRCRLMLQIDYEPEGLIERIGTLLGVPYFDVLRDLRRFVAFVEQAAVATGGWRGKILNRDEEPRPIPVPVAAAPPLR